jgi:hypothetical protein
MAWVKRNLIFVIIVAVGLIATGYCGYLLSAALSGNASVSGEYTDTEQKLDGLQKSTPPASPENIEAAKADQERVRTFLTDFRKSFAAFPTAPNVDERGFVEHLQLTLRRFAAEATNAGVELAPDCYFSFSDERQKMSFSPDCIPTWMQELEDINVILRILFESKINYFESIQRVPACMDDINGNDVLQASLGSNTWGVVMPYKVTFRAFSTELASVLGAFADSSNCFIVKYVNVTPSKAPLPQVTEPTSQPQQRYTQMPEYNNPYAMDDGGGGRRSYRRPMPRQQETLVINTPAAPARPETMLQETPLYITIVVDAVNLKQEANPNDAANAKSAVRVK